MGVSAGNPLDWLFPLAAAAVPAALWLLRDRIGRGPACAVLVYGLLIAPASGFFDVYFFRYAPVQDHFQYFACTGLAAFAAALVARALPRPVPFRAASLVLVALLAALSFQRAAVFSDSGTLWRDTLARNPRAWMAHVNLGNMLLDGGRTADAAGHFEAALRVRPNSIEALIGLGEVLAREGKAAEAEARYREAIALRPGQAQARNNLGVLLMEQGRGEEALAQYDAALATAPSYPEARMNRGILLVRMGRQDEGIEECARGGAAAARQRGRAPGPRERAAVHGPGGRGRGRGGGRRRTSSRGWLARRARRAPGGGGIEGVVGGAAGGGNDGTDGGGAGQAESRNDEGMRLANEGRYREAMEHFRAAIRSRPDFAIAHYNLGLALERLGRRQEAAASYRDAIARQPDLKEPHGNLAILLYGSGDYAGAWAEVRAFQRLGGEPNPRFLQALAAKLPPPS